MCSHSHSCVSQTRTRCHQAVLDSSAGRQAMELKRLADEAGHTLTVLEYKGRWLPDFPREAIAGMETFEAREDDVVVCAYPKSGTHWVWEMVRFLLAGSTDLPVIEKDEAMMEFKLPQELGNLRSPRPLNTHYHFELLPADVFRKGCKLVYVSRDPRDVAVSYFHHHRKLVQYYQYGGQWKDYFHLFLNGQMDYESWFAYTRGWERGLQAHPELAVHVTSYEELQADTFAGLQKLANFLGVRVDQKFLVQVVKTCSFDVMRATKGVREVSEENNSPIMYRKGKVGDWKNCFTVAQSGLFDDVFEREMIESWAYELYSHTKKGSRGT